MCRAVSILDREAVAPGVLPAVAEAVVVTVVEAEMAAGVVGFFAGICDVEPFWIVVVPACCMTLFLGFAPDMTLTTLWPPELVPTLTTFCPPAIMLCSCEADIIVLLTGPV